MIQEIKKIIDPITGQICVHTGRYHGSMLIIDFGKKYPPKKGQKYESYDWTLSIHNCKWWLKQNEKYITSYRDRYPKISQNIKLLENKKIEDIKLNRGLKQTIFKFSDKLVLKVEQIKTKYETWDLKIPSGQYLLIGPGSDWKLVDKDYVG